MNPIRRFLKRSLTPSVIAVALTLIIVLGGVGVTLGEAHLIPYNHPLYITAENLLLISTIFIIFYDTMTHSDRRKDAPTNAPDAASPPPHPLWKSALLLIPLALTVLLRLVSANTPLLTYLLALLLIFILPGFALTAALLPPNSPLWMRLALIPIMSLTTQLILLAWASMLNIPITPALILSGAVALTLIGFIIPRLRRPAV